MPVTKTATRALRKSKIRASHNKVIRTNLKETIRKIKKETSAHKGTVPAETLQKAYKMIDKAAKTHIIHANKAARLKSRLTKKIATGTTKAKSKS